MATSTIPPIDPQSQTLPQQTFQQATPGMTPPAQSAATPAPQSAPVNHGHNLLKALVNGAHQVGQIMYNVNNPDQAVGRQQQQQDQLKQLQQQHDEEYRKVIYAGITDPNSTPDQRTALGTLLQHLGDPNVSENDRLSAFVKGIAAFAPQNPLSPEDRIKAERIKAGLDPRAGTETQDMKPYKLADGTTTYLDAKQPGKIPPGATPILPNADQPKTPKGLKLLGSENDHYGVQDEDTGKQYLPSQLGPNGNAPPEAKEIWKSQQDAKAAKEADEQKKEDFRAAQSAKTIQAGFEKMGQSQQFTELMAQYRSDLGEYRAIDKTASDAEANVKALQSQYQNAKTNTDRSVADNELQNFYTTVVQKGGRKTAAELALTLKIGSLGLNLEQAFQKARTGELPEPLRKSLLEGMKAVADEQRNEADQKKPALPEIKAPEGPQTKALKAKANSGGPKKLTAKDLEAVLP